MDEQPDVPPFPIVRVGRVPAEPEQRHWLVEGLWADGAVGVIGGTPKSCKTWLALELAVAVASGTPCMGRYAVPKAGPVLLYAAEDSAAAIRQRVAAIAQARGVRQLDRLAVGLITEPKLLLDMPGHQLRLDATLTAVKPRLLILDPLVRLHRGDENSSTDISQLLGFLRSLQREHDVAIALVHHVRKSGAGQPGQALRGSGDLHAWGDSNLYLLRRKGELHLHVEHRSRASPSPVGVRLASGPPRLEVGEVNESAGNTELERAVVDALTERSPITRSDLRACLRVRNERLGEALTQLERAGQVRRTAEGWSVPRSRP